MFTGAVLLRIELHNKRERQSCYGGTVLTVQPGPERKGKELLYNRISVHFHLKFGRKIFFCASLKRVSRSNERTPYQRVLVDLTKLIA